MDRVDRVDQVNKDRASKDPARKDPVRKDRASKDPAVAGTSPKALQKRVGVVLPSLGNSPH